MNIHNNQVSQSGVKYDDKLFHTTVVLHESVEKYLRLLPHHISSEKKPLLHNPENQHISVLTTTMGRSGWMYQHRVV